MLLPIRGAHFRPPALGILSVLPVGIELQLEPEPENQYDPNAIKVILQTSSLPTDEEFTQKLDISVAGAGFSIDQILSQPSIHLAYVGKEYCPQLLPLLDQIVAQFIVQSDGKPAIRIGKKAN